MKKPTLVRRVLTLLLGLTVSILWLLNLHLTPATAWLTYLPQVGTALWLALLWRLYRQILPPYTRPFCGNILIANDKTLSTILQDDRLGRKKVMLFCRDATAARRQLKVMKKVAKQLPDVTFIHARLTRYPKLSCQCADGTPHFVVQYSIPAGKLPESPVKLPDRLFVREPICGPLTYEQMLRKSVSRSWEDSPDIPQTLRALQASLEAERYRIGFQQTQISDSHLRESSNTTVRSLLEDEQIPSVMVYFCEVAPETFSEQCKVVRALAERMHDQALFVRCRWQFGAMICKYCDGEEHPFFMVQVRWSAGKIKRALFCGYHLSEKLLGATITKTIARLKQELAANEPSYESPGGSEDDRH